jgi:rhodanese-related sulfurtransferase
MKNTLVLSFAIAAASLTACKDNPAPIVVAPAQPAPAAAAPAPAATVPTAAAEEKKLEELTPAEVEKRRKEPNFYVFDNNTKDRFVKGHVPGAKWVDPSAITAVDLPTDKNAVLVFYCANTACSACHVGAEAAIKLGYAKVYIMPEGIMGWEAAKLPVEQAKV